jgi:beta-lactamase class A
MGVTGGGLTMRKLLLILLALAAIAAALLAMPYLRYQQSSGVVPAWVRFGGLEVNGATRAEVAAALQRGLDEPVAAWYGDTRVLLRPVRVGFQVDVDGMLAEAGTYDTGDRLLRYLVELSLERPIRTDNVALRYVLDEAALDAWLDEVAAEHDRPPGMPQPLLETLTLAPGKPGTAMDRAAARDLIVTALANPADRMVHLPVAESPAPPMDVKALGGLLEEVLEEFPGIGSIYLHFLPTGEEIAINADVAYAGTSTLKIPITTEVFRKLDAPPGIDTRKIISETMMQSGNFTANLMLGIIGDGDWDAGVRVLNESFKTLGMHNTFMATPYDRQLPVTPRIVTEANSRTDINTQPDPYIQTTPRDMGSALQMLVACSEGGGTLIAAYSDAITQAECQQALDFIALNEMTELLVGGLPPGTKAVHKHGYVSDTHGDVAAIWSPAGPYVLAVFLHRPIWLEWHYSNPTMQTLGRATWNFFSNQYEGLPEARLLEQVRNADAQKGSQDQASDPASPGNQQDGRELFGLRVDDVLDRIRSGLGDVRDSLNRLLTGVLNR